MTLYHGPGEEIRRDAMPSPVKFYKRKSQEKHFAAHRKLSDFPARVNERGCFWPSAPSTRFAAQPSAAVWIFTPSGFHRIVATKPICSETDKQNGCQVPTMVLSEAHGLSLFRVIREGLGSSGRLGARGTQRLTSQWRLTLEPECLKNRRATAWRISRRWRRIPETLKLFVVSDVGRRTRLLSSKRSK